jgi:hypothetical protein
MKMPPEMKKQHDEFLASERKKELLSRRRLATTAERTPAECRCSLRIRLAGDGCSVCNPELWKELRAESDESPNGEHSNTPTPRA